MPIYRERYADNWQDIARRVKAAASWRCQHCGQQCLRPGEKPKGLSRSLVDDANAIGSSFKLYARR